MRCNYSNKNEQRRCVKLQELIYELSEAAGVDRNDAISFTSILLSNMKEHLLKGHNLNLGELGVLTHHVLSADKGSEIRYTPSLPLLKEINERSKFVIENA